ncbi:hypothetical protein GQ41_2142 [Arenibacter algicola]|uniref:Uncharacterized protein n=1 Tax=Arenibacter algicola TaxID=616991 RepID=A0ABY3AAN5_9FLAO
MYFALIFRMEYESSKQVILALVRSLGIKQRSSSVSALVLNLQH